MADFLAGCFAAGVFVAAVLAAGRFLADFAAVAPSACGEEERAGRFAVRFAGGDASAGRGDSADGGSVGAPEPRLTATPVGLSSCVPATSALNCAPGRNDGTWVASTRTVSPVRGLRATRGARSRFSNTPKPVIVTLSPRWTARTTASTKPSTTAVVVRRSVPSFSVRLSMSSALFIGASSTDGGPSRTDCTPR